MDTNNNRISALCPYRACRIVTDPEGWVGITEVEPCTRCRERDAERAKRAAYHRDLVQTVADAAIWADNDNSEEADEALEIAFSNALVVMANADSDSAPTIHANKRAWERRRWRIEMRESFDGGWSARFWRGRDCVAESDGIHDERADAVSSVVQAVRARRPMRRAA